MTLYGVSAKAQRRTEQHQTRSQSAYNARQSRQSYEHVEDLQKRLANGLHARNAKVAYQNRTLRTDKKGVPVILQATAVLLGVALLSGCVNADTPADDDKPTTPTYKAPTKQVYEQPTKPVVTPPIVSPTQIVTPTPAEPTPEPVDKCPDEKHLENYVDAEGCLNTQYQDRDQDRAIDGENIVLNLTNEQQKALANYLDAKFKAIYRVLDGTNTTREYLGEISFGTYSHMNMPSNATNMSAEELAKLLADTDRDSLGDGLEIEGRLGLTRDIFPLGYEPDPRHIDIYLEIRGTKIVNESSPDHGKSYIVPPPVIPYVQSVFANLTEIKNVDGEEGVRMHLLESPIMEVKQFTVPENEAVSALRNEFYMDKSVWARGLYLPDWTAQAAGRAIPLPDRTGIDNIFVGAFGKMWTDYSWEEYQKRDSRDRERYDTGIAWITMHEFGHTFNLPHSEPYTSFMSESRLDTPLTLTTPEQNLFVKNLAKRSVVLEH